MKSLREMALRLASLEIYAVVISVVASMVWNRLLAVALGVTAFFALLRWLVRRRFTSHTPVDGGIACLLLFGLSTLFITTMPETTWPQVLRLLLGIGMYYAIVNWAVTNNRFSWLVAGFLLAGIGLALVAPIAVDWNVLKIPFLPATLYKSFRVLLSDAVHPNVMAGNILILLPIPVALLLFAWREQKWFWRVFTGVSVVTMFTVLILSQSRGAWLAFLAVCGILLIFRWRWGWGLIGLGVVLGTVAVSVWGGAAITRWFTTDDSFTSLQSRIEVWGRAIYMIRDFPLGIGMGLFGNLADRLYPFFLSPVGTIPHAHNLFLQIAVDLGIPGLLAWLAIFSTMTAYAWRIFRSGSLAKDAWRAGLGAGLLCSQFALGLHGLVDAVTWGAVRSAPLVWALWGAITAFSQAQFAAIPSNQIARRTAIFLQPSFRLWVTLILLVLLSAFAWLPQVLRTYQLALPLLNMPGVSATAPPSQPKFCDTWDFTGQTASRFSQLANNQRYMLGSLMVSLGCVDWAAHVLPEFTTASERADLLAYQWGRIAWARGDKAKAASLWRQSHNIDNYLLLQARASQSNDLQAASQWYEAAIMSADNPDEQAEFSWRIQRNCAAK